ncbi:type II toxin-antitoxin system RelE/ParE family toxin [Blastopirellula sp. JC732]|uniref:Type II toxin-antitoxin system RelE/ParE family toxin n=1 Tax=Blastopirellula sediminis TaxID=2894196 RepID=A0A9X1MQ64_9BACT|nr:type II toxin-antitoxin system RelE/ParE family toxin [Blastopirellula sediminis]MCC9605809.1 type II toxin-antitoxin system RelE/ParE family toxin [Blastopirellula sediminis]MCC9630891.1 type II toxin-antitoxin system RelE/ParE family toxin [Blastopirellula sediminis]
MAKVRFTPLAYRDLEEIVAWYESKRLGVGYQFELAIGQVIQRIEQYPLSCELVLNEIRQALVRRFPYAIYYQLRDENQIAVVLAILHTSRDIPPEEIVARQ